MGGLANEQWGQAVELCRLIKLAYAMYAKDPLTPKFPGFPGYDFVAWVQMRDFDFYSNESPYCFYGFIAQKKVELNRYVLVMRGTANGEELYGDFESATSVPFEKSGKVAYGFNRIFQTLRVVGPDGKSVSKFWGKDFPAQVKAVIKKHSVSTAPETTESQKRITVTAHSLGAALATLYVAKAASDEELKIEQLCTFASPLVGDNSFANWFDNLHIPSWRIVNFMDQITRVPPTFLGFQHIQQEFTYTSGDDTRNSIDCYHSIDTYLHLLDPAKWPLDDFCQYIGPAEA